MITMKRNLIVQVTFETQVEVDIPEDSNIEDALYKRGLEIADTLNDIRSTEISTDNGVQFNSLYWSMTRSEVFDESDFIGDKYF